MNSSSERLRMAQVPSGVRVEDVPAEQAIEALLERRAAEREAASAAAVREELAQTIEALAAGFETERKALGEELSRSAVELGIEVARAILRTELPAERYELEPVIRECLALATEGRGAARVHLNPTDAERMAELPWRAGTELVPDSAVRRGEVRVESDLGVVVRNPDECLARAREALLEELSR